MIVYNFLVLTIVIYCEAKTYPLDNIKPENYTTVRNINFVEVIKLDLKRNNDDYKEITQENNINNNNKIDVIPNKDRQSKTKTEAAEIKKRGYRRKNGESYEEYDYEDTIKRVTESGYVFKSNTNKSEVLFVKNIPQKIYIQRNQSKFDNRDKIMLPTIKNFSFTPSMKDLKVKRNQHIEIPKFVKKNKIDKFKQFMNKNEGLLKDFVKNKFTAQTRQTRFRDFSISNDNLNLRKPKTSDSVMKEIQRTGDNNDGQLPSPDLLDMAPAKGGRIHKQREKGRLCHRHVLMPEGPKYDSRGRWYVPAHELVASRAYNVTRRPKLLLPRCCNCCKKSVLGCE